MSITKTRLQSKFRVVLKPLFFAGFTISILAVQLAGISDHTVVNFSETHIESLEALVSENITAVDFSRSTEESPFHRKHIHGNFHVHDFLVYSPIQIQTSPRISQLDMLRATHWLPYDYIGSLFRPPSNIPLV